MTRHNTARALALASGLVVVLAGCSSNGSGGDKTPTSTTAVSSPSVPATSAAPAGTTAAPSQPTSSKPPAATGSGACKYVTTAQATALAKSPVKAGVSRKLNTGPVPFNYCDYIFDPGNAPGVMVAVADLGGNGKSLFGQYRASEQTQSDYLPVSAVGDEAFYSNGNLNLRKGNTGLIVFVGRANGSPRGEEGIPDEKKLAALILPQL
ncbi:MAG: hypothetical protein QOC66_3152 [Pseudonocardiales bacterium]|jgi:hypothetical protein|nr:hypothetical protein [Pseudonocardiales bacterium]